MNYRTAKSNMEANLNYIEGFQKKHGNSVTNSISSLL